MIRALYSAASGMSAQQLNVDNIAHNLANANTVGFKMRRAQFQDLLYQTIEQMEDAVRTAGNKKLEFCKACFTGTYPTGDITEQVQSDLANALLRILEALN